MAGSLLDVFKDFEYDEDEDSFFHETFSQLKGKKEEQNGEYEREHENEVEEKKKKKSPASLQISESNTRATLDTFEEAFTVLKSIKTAHEPSSFTAINAFLHYRRGIQT